VLPEIANPLPIICAYSAFAMLYLFCLERRNEFLRLRFGREIATFPLVRLRQFRRDSDLPTAIFSSNGFHSLTPIRRQILAGKAHFSNFLAGEFRPERAQG
jgi:hypothetical protein